MFKRQRLANVFHGLCTERFFTSTLETTQFRTGDINDGYRRNNVLCCMMEYHHLSFLSDLLLGRYELRIIIIHHCYQKKNSLCSSME